MLGVRKWRWATLMRTTNSATAPYIDSDDRDRIGDPANRGTSLRPPAGGGPSETSGGMSLSEAASASVQPKSGTCFEQPDLFPVFFNP